MGAKLYNFFRNTLRDLSRILPAFIVLGLLFAFFGGSSANGIRRGLANLSQGVIFKDYQTTDIGYRVQDPISGGRLTVGMPDESIVPSIVLPASSNSSLKQHPALNVPAAVAPRLPIQGCIPQTAIMCSPVKVYTPSYLPPASGYPPVAVPSHETVIGPSQPVPIHQLPTYPIPISHIPVYTSNVIHPRQSETSETWLSDPQIYKPQSRQDVREMVVMPSSPPLLTSKIPSTNTKTWQDVFTQVIAQQGFSLPDDPGWATYVSEYWKGKMNQGAQGIQTPYFCYSSVGYRILTTHHTARPPNCGDVSQNAALSLDLTALTHLLP